MKTGVYSISLLAGAWALIAAGTAQAGLITFEYEGTEDYFQDELGTLPSPKNDRPELIEEVEEEA